jgi:hypothetical protein
MAKEEIVTFEMPSVREISIGSFNAEDEVC